MWPWHFFHHPLVQSLWCVAHDKGPFHCSISFHVFPYFNCIRQSHDKFTFRPWLCQLSQVYVVLKLRRGSRGSSDSINSRGVIYIFFSLSVSWAISQLQWETNTLWDPLWFEGTFEKSTWDQKHGNCFNIHTVLHLYEAFEITVDKRPSYHLSGLDPHPHTRIFSVILNVKHRFQNWCLKIFGAEL